MSNWSDDTDRARLTCSFFLKKAALKMKTFRLKLYKEMTSLEKFGLGSYINLLLKNDSLRYRFPFTNLVRHFVKKGWKTSVGSRISQGAPTPEGRREQAISAIFPENCMKMKKFWPRGGREGRHWKHFNIDCDRTFTALRDEKTMLLRIMSILCCSKAGTHYARTHARNQHHRPPPPYTHTNKTTPLKSLMKD